MGRNGERLAVGSHEYTVAAAIVSPVDPPLPCYGLKLCDLPVQGLRRMATRSLVAVLIDQMVLRATSKHKRDAVAINAAGAAQVCATEVIEAIFFTAG